MTKHPTIKFTAEVSEMETTFQNTNISKGERLKKNTQFLICMHTSRPTDGEILVYTLHFIPPKFSSMERL